ENLLEAARKGKFREDLYHRFNEFKIDVPPLRERQDDLLIFAQYFLDQTNAELSKTIKGFSKEVQDIFKRYPWFGNLRELKNVIKRATLLSTGAYIDAASLPFEITHYHQLLTEDHEEEHEIIKHSSGTENRLKEANLDAEYEVILAALKQANYNKSKAAKLLNIDRKTLYNKMKQIPAFNLDL
ncbi:MAG: sigma-54-dependent Fis family transcriptional regulator, partial [Bacteroidetes bacterium]|nr:sigma-54-dependent Fis family transcriptional regulator [Bacteroidota bacterium]